MMIIKKHYFILGFQFIRRERRQSDTVIDEIQKDPRFSILKRHRSLDSLLKENKEK